MINSQVLEKEGYNFFSTIIESMRRSVQKSRQILLGNSSSRRDELAVSIEEIITNWMFDRQDSLAKKKASLEDISFFALKIGDFPNHVQLEEALREIFFLKEKAESTVDVLENMKKIFRQGKKEKISEEDILLLEIVSEKTLLAIEELNNAKILLVSRLNKEKLEIKGDLEKATVKFASAKKVMNVAAAKLHKTELLSHSLNEFTENVESVFSKLEVIHP